MTRTVAPGWVLTLLVAVWMVQGSAAQDRAAQTSGIHDQFSITLPDGWSTYDQNQAISGKTSFVGMVVFSAEPLTKEGATTADAETLAKVSRGDVASFFVERTAATKSMECDKLSRSVIYDIGTTINKDPAIATTGRRLLGGLAPDHKDTELGGCRGVKFLLEANKNDPAKHWKVDVRAVSDGKILYLFSLRNTGANYERNLAAFEQAMSTVRFKSVK